VKSNNSKSTRCNYIETRKQQIQSVVRSRIPSRHHAEYKQFSRFLELLNNDLLYILFDMISQLAIPSIVQPYSNTLCSV